MGACVWIVIVSRLETVVRICQLEDAQENRHWSALIHRYRWRGPSMHASPNKIKFFPEILVLTKTSKTALYSGLL